MSVDELINMIVSALVAAASLTFVVVYQVKAPWRSTPMGWHLMAFAASIGGLGLYTVVITLVGTDGPAATALRIVRSTLLLVLAALMIQRTVMVIRAQQGRK